MSSSATVIGGVLWEGVSNMFHSPFESMYTKIKSLVKYLLLPWWRRSYLATKYIHDGITAQVAMSKLGVIET